MNKTFTRYILLLLIISPFFPGCNAELDVPEAFSGSLQLDHYLAIGDGFTAGYTNGGLYAAGQHASFPRLMANQFHLTGSDTSFKQAVLPLNGSGYIELISMRERGCDLVEPLPEFRFREAAVNWAVNIAGQGPFQNIGVPGMRVGNLHENQASIENPYMTRLVENPGTDHYTALIDQQESFHFFTLWLGTEDLMSYALSGGTNSLNTLTDPGVFRESYRALLDHILLKPGTKGVVASIPNIIEFPYFNHIPHTIINLPECIEIDLPLYIEAGDPVQVRVATEEDRILLPIEAELGVNGYGLTADVAIPDSLVLDAEEVEIVRNQIEVYNQILTELMLEVEIEYPRRVAFLDLYRHFAFNLLPGRVYDGILVSKKYLNGGVFSLDGYSTTARGNALIANAFIKACNNYFGSRIPTLNISDYPGVEFP